MKIKQRATTKLVKQVLLAAVAITGSALTSADELSDLFTKGTVTADFRLRNEQVNQTGMSDAIATTLRSRITGRSGVVYGLQFGLQGQAVSSFNDQDHYNASPDDCPGHLFCNNARIIDPNDAYVNEAFLKYTGIEKTAFTYGRQHIDLDNERFIGSVAWRQNDQTFGAFRFDNELIPKTKMTIARVYDVHRVFGDNVPNGDHPQSTNLYNVAVAVNDAFKPVVYHYDIDNRDNNKSGPVPNVNLSSKSSGLRVTGSYPKKEGDRFIYAAEFAHQGEGDDNMVNYSENYQLIEVGGEYKTVVFTLGHEVLGGDADGTTATEFQTPLATLHKFNGWADMFLTTPDGGLVDTYASVTIPFMGVKTVIAYHDFDRDDTNNAIGATDSLGDEWDISVGKTIMKNYNVAVKYADYDSDNEMPSNNKSTRKVWLEASAHFE